VNDNVEHVLLALADVAYEATREFVGIRKPRSAGYFHAYEHDHAGVCLPVFRRSAELPPSGRDTLANADH
jgi:hypothetical protein